MRTGTGRRGRPGKTVAATSTKDKVTDSRKSRGRDKSAATRTKAKDTDSGSDSDRSTTARTIQSSSRRRPKNSSPTENSDSDVDTKKQKKNPPRPAKVARHMSDAIPSTSKTPRRLRGTETPPKRLREAATAARATFKRVDSSDDEQPEVVQLEESASDEDKVSDGKPSSPSDSNDDSSGSEYGVGKKRSSPSKRTATYNAATASKMAKFMTETFRELHRAQSQPKVDSFIVYLSDEMKSLSSEQKDEFKWGVMDILKNIKKAGKSKSKSTHK